MVNVARGFWLASALMTSAAVCYAANSSQVFRCVDADGHVVFTDTSCGSKAEKVEIVESSGGLSPIKDGRGLSAQEKAELGAIEARDAQVAADRAAGAGQAVGGSTPAAAAPSSSEPTHRSGY